MSNDLYKALQQCMTLLDAGVPAEECLTRFPQHSRELRPLLAAAAGSGASFQMPVAAKLRVWQQVMSHWDRRHAPKQRWWMSLGWSTRWAAVAAAAVLVIMLVGGGVGTAAAAQDSTPGSALYSVKLLREDVRLWFTRSVEEKVAIYADYSRERAQEIVQLTRSNQQDLAGVSLSRLEEHLTAVDEIWTESATDSSTYNPQDTAIIETLDEVLLPIGDESPVLEVISSASEDTYPCLQYTLQVLRQAREQVNSSLEAVGRGLPERTATSDGGPGTLCPR